MNKIFAVFILLPAFAFAELNWEQCSSGRTPLFISSDVCEDTPCQFTQGQALHFFMRFAPGIY